LSVMLKKGLAVVLGVAFFGFLIELSSPPTDSTSASSLSAQGHVAAVCAQVVTEKRLRAIVIGGTGAVGKELVNTLIQCPAYVKVTLLVRKFLPIEDPTKKISQQIVDFDNLENYSGIFQDHDLIFSCFGTTRAQAGSAEILQKLITSTLSALQNSQKREE